MTKSHVTFACSLWSSPRESWSDAGQQTGKKARVKGAGVKRLPMTAYVGGKSTGNHAASRQKYPSHFCLCPRIPSAPTMYCWWLFEIVRKKGSKKPTNSCVCVLSVLTSKLGRPTTMCRERAREVPSATGAGRRRIRGTIWFHNRRTRNISARSSG